MISIDQLTGSPCAWVLVGCVHHQDGSWALVVWSMCRDDESVVALVLTHLVRAQTRLQGGLADGFFDILEMECCCCCFSWLACAFILGWIMNMG